MLLLLTGGYQIGKIHINTFLLMFCGINFRASNSGSCSAEVENISFETSNFDLSTHQTIGIYSGIIGGVVTIVMSRAILTFLICLSAAHTLHNKMFRSILRAPISFFDTNPVGT